MKQFYSSAQDTCSSGAEVNPFRCQGFVRGGTIACRDGSRRAIQSLPAFLRALLVTDGTVTKILEAYFWEPVMVDTLYQEFVAAEAAIPWVAIHPGDRALMRRVRLRGGDSGHEYARADSVIRAEHVPDHFRQRLIDREIGIGALIRDSGLESYREVMEVGVNPSTGPSPSPSPSPSSSGPSPSSPSPSSPSPSSPSPSLAPATGGSATHSEGLDDPPEPSPSGETLFRTYRIIIDGEPVILITETFPLALFCPASSGQGTPSRART